MIKKKFILLILVFLILFSNIISLIFPIITINQKKYIGYCKQFDLLDVENENKYVTREEFLEAMLKSIGMTKLIFQDYSNVDYGSPPTDDFSSDTGQYSSLTEENFTKVYDHFVMCYMAQDAQCMQIYDTVNPESGDRVYEYRGQDYIKMNEATAMLQACLSPVEVSDYQAFHKQSLEFKKLYLYSRFSGIVCPVDSSFWSIGEFKIKRRDLCILLGRFLERKRYKYLIDEGQSSKDVKFDEKRSMTYYEYLINVKGTVPGMSRGRFP